MKKYLINTIVFLFPIIFIFAFTILFYQTDNGDLIRMGYIMSDSNYREIFGKEFARNINYYKISDIENTKNRYDILTIGDSFSEYERCGYINYLAEYNNNKIIHLDHFLHEGTPIESLYGILNGDLLDKIDIDYIILQSVERNSIPYSLDTTKVITLNGIHQKVKNEKKNKIKKPSHLRFLQNRAAKFVRYNLMYLFQRNTFYSEVHRVQTSKNLFSNNKNELLFYHGDISSIWINNNRDSVLKLNNILNNLSNKLNNRGIRLIFLPSPDKYDIYYDYIISKQKFPKPLFFNHLDNMKKEYLYLNSKQILDCAIQVKKDIYFYDDTHWSPWASQLIALELEKILDK